MTREVRALADRDGKNPGKMTREELERKLKETFFCPDTIDDTVSRELEELLEALEEQWPLPEGPDPEEGWRQFLTDRAGELDEILAAEPRQEEKPRVRAARPHTAPKLLRRVLVAAVVVVLLAGAALAADSLGLVAWVPQWNALSGRFEPTAQEGMPERPIPTALAELGIAEPVYPARLPEGFVITESHISEEPLLLVEQYARGSERLSITVAPLKGVRSAVYQRSGVALRELQGGLKAHFVFENEGTVTAICFSKNYATYISGDLTVEEITGIILSIGTTEEGGELS